MYYRLFAALALVSLAFGAGGCSSFWSSSNRPEKKGYKEVRMPLQTGSLLQRRVQVKADRDSKAKKKKKETAPTRKPEAEPTPTPTPEEEATPQPERFR